MATERGGTAEAPCGVGDGEVRSPSSRIHEALRVLRTVLGVPDYERYLEHARERHPGERLLTREEFQRERLAARYTRPGSRCC